MDQDADSMVGQSVSDLPLTLSGGSTATLSDFAGRWLVLYFYPKDSTPGCTTEGQQFRDLYPKFLKAGAIVAGVSRDSLKSHANFAAKQGLQFELASDADETLCRAFDVIREKQMYGRKVIGIERSTFLIDPAGVVRQAWRRVKVPGHVQTVLATLQSARSQ